MSLWEGDYDKSSPSLKPNTSSSSSSSSDSSSSSLPTNNNNNMYLERIGNYFVLPEKRPTTNIQRTICDDGGDDGEGDDEDDEVHHDHRRASISCPNRNKMDTQINLNGDNSILLPRILIKNHHGIKGSSNAASSNDYSGFDRCYNQTLSIMGKKKKNWVNVNNNNNNPNHSNNTTHNNNHVNGNFYSTDKSGSSGYYGSNLYSTSSFDDHIYSEPVIDHYNNCNILINSSSNNNNNSNGNYGNSSKIIDKLPTIMEGVDGQIPRPVWPIDYDDSLIDINLESFLIQNGNSNNNPSDENSNRNSNSSNNNNNENYNLAFDHNELPMINLQHTREILEEICFKLNNLIGSEDANVENDIKVLKNDLNEYIKVINKNNDVEIRKLCDNLSKNTKMLAIKNALENQRYYNYNYNEYNNIIFNTNHIYGSGSGSNYGQIKRQMSIRSVNDPNFHFQTKFPTIVDGIGVDLHNTNNRNNTNDDDLITTDHSNININSNSSSNEDDSKPSNNKSNLSVNNVVINSDKNMINTAKNHDHDKNMILEWHRNKPSIWEMYYGKNRPPQTIMKKIRGNRKTKNKTTQAVIAYPSSRPESDFTLDLPRAEQLRIKMKKEKKFRNRCRIVMTFFSLIFFLLTVMGVSLILTRGKRMFGSML